MQQTCEVPSSPAGMRGLPEAAGESIFNGEQSLIACALSMATVPVQMVESLPLMPHQSWFLSRVRPVHHTDTYIAQECQVYDPFKLCPAACAAGTWTLWECRA